MTMSQIDPVDDADQTLQRIIDRLKTDEQFREQVAEDPLATIRADYQFLPTRSQLRAFIGIPGDLTSTDSWESWMIDRTVLTILTPRVDQLQPALPTQPITYNVTLSNWPTNVTVILKYLLNQLRNPEIWQKAVIDPIQTCFGPASPIKGKHWPSTDLVRQFIGSPLSGSTDPNSDDIWLDWMVNRTVLTVLALEVPQLPNAPISLNNCEGPDPEGDEFAASQPQPADSASDTAEQSYS